MSEKCKWCHAENLHWRYHRESGSQRLFNDRGELHDCREYRDAHRQKYESSIEKKLSKGQFGDRS